MDPVLREFILAFLTLVGAWILSRLSNFILDQIGTIVIGRTKSSLDDVILKAAQTPIRLLILIGGGELALAQLSIIQEAWSDELDRVFFTLYFLFIYIFLYKLIGGLINWYGHEIAEKTETELDDRFLNLFRRIGLLTLTIVFIITLLGRFGIEISALVTTFGIGSLAVALAAQETLGDMITGFTIMLDQPFKVGDRVEIQDINTWGDVIDIGIRTTRILTRDNRMVSIPNSVIGKGLVVNYSDPNTIYRVETNVGVAYGTELEFARQVMIKAVEAEAWVMKDKNVEALMLEFGDSALIFRVRCWIENYVETRRIIDKLNSALYKALNKESIGIPFPQRDLHFISSVKVEDITNKNGSKKAV